MTESLILDPVCKAQLGMWLGNVKFSTLYRQTRDTINAGTFHQLCNAKGATVTVAKLATGTIIGGYTSLAWACTGGYRADPTAFLFRLYNARVFQPFRSTVKAPDGANAIHDVANYGPTFGNAHDLIFFTNNALAVGTNITGNHGYVLPAGGAFDLAGAQNGWVVEELEVLLVTKDSSLLQNPWQRVDWTVTSRDDQKAKVSSYTPKYGKELDVGFSNVLVIGGTGAGKTTFLSTIASVMLGRIVALSAKGTGTDSLTLKLLKNKIEGVPNVRFWDSKGWSASTYRLGEMSHIVDGNIPHDFPLQNAITPESPGFIATPKFSQKVHVILILVNAEAASDAAYLTRIREFRDLARTRGIPIVIGVTKVDLVDKAVLENELLDGSAISNVFRSVAVKDLITRIASETGIDVQYIVPIKGYWNEYSTNIYVDILCLLVLRKLLDCADDNFIFKNNSRLMAEEDLPQQKGVHKDS